MRHFQRQIRRAAILFCACAAASPVLAEQVECTWDGALLFDTWFFESTQIGPSDRWTCDDDGDPMFAYPDLFIDLGPPVSITTFVARIGPDGADDVSLVAFHPIALDKLELINGSSVTISEASDLIIENTHNGNAGVIDSDGTVWLAGSNNIPANADLQIDGSVTLTGGGEVLLDGTLINFPGSIDGDKLVNVDNTISGNGNVLFVEIENGGPSRAGNRCDNLSFAGTGVCSRHAAALQ